MGEQQDGRAAARKEHALILIENALIENQNHDRSLQVEAVYDYLRIAGLLTAPDAPSGTTKDHILRATVTEELIARMADTIGMDIDRLNAVLDGKAEFGDSVARKFRMYFRTSKEFWLNLATPAPGGTEEADHA